MRYFKYFLLASLFVGFGALIGAPSANAVSDYDDVITTVDSLHLKRDEYNTVGEPKYDKLTAFDFKYRWAEFTLANVFDTPFVIDGTEYTVQIGNTFGTTQADAVIAWQNKKNWSVAQFYQPSGEMRIAINYTTEENTSLEFNEPTGYGRKQLSYEGDNSYTIIVQLNASSTIDVSYSKSSVNSHTAIAYQGTYPKNPLFIFWDITYPSSYEGVTPPDSTSPPSQQIPTAPNWYISNIINNIGTFSDSNFNTTNMSYPFLCTDDLAPVLHWELFRNLENDENVLMTSGTMSATGQIVYDFGKYDGDRQYTILGWYDCGDDTEFPNQGRLQFTINAAGTQSIQLFQECIKADFPWVDINNCYENLTTVFNLLYFGEIKFPSFTFNPQCHSLNTLDDWLGLPNGYQVCPQIPSFVRSVVTPFVAFMLGLVTIGFIQKIRTDFDG